MQPRYETWRSLAPEKREFTIIHTRRLLESLLRHKNIPVYEAALESKTPEELAEWMFSSYNAVLSQGTEADPLLNYGNTQALTAWGMRYDEFVGRPSQSTVELSLCQERAKILAQVKTQGLVYPYTGIRIAKDGKRFRMKDAKIWTVQDERSNPIGMAAMFPDWEFVE